MSVYYCHSYCAMHVHNTMTARIIVNWLTGLFTCSQQIRTVLTSLFVSVKRTEEGGGKPGADDDTGRSTHLLACSCQQTSTTCFTGDGDYWTIVFEVWPANRSGWHLSRRSWILLHWRSASFITDDSDPIHLNRPRIPRSDSDPKIVRSLGVTEVNLLQ